MIDLTARVSDIVADMLAVLGPGELIGELGYRGGQTIVDDYLREVRPLFLPKRPASTILRSRAGEEKRFS
jgi:hypothetical protein